MSALPKCPICGEDSLRPVDYMSDEGSLHYLVECLSCGTEYHHEKFCGYNGVMGFFEYECAGRTCENEAQFEDGESAWKCSKCGKERKCAEDEPAYRFCPDCGAEVLEW